MFLVNKLLDQIFPPRETELAVRLLAFSDLRQLCSPQQCQRHIFLLPYQHPSVRACIIEAKFHNNRKAQKFLGTILSNYLHNTYGANCVCVPIPLSRKRSRERGYNQVAAILDAASIPHQPGLTRSVDKASQSSLGRQDRLQNVADVFCSHDLRVSATTSILVIDDVITTGATLEAAYAVLSSKHDLVIGLALAH